MDYRLRVTDTPRGIAPGVTAETPPVALAWHVLRGEYQRQAAARRQAEAEAEQVRDVLADIAGEVLRIRSLAAAASAVDSARNLPGVADRIETALRNLGVVIVGQVGLPYTDEVMELIDNVAQLPDPLLASPVIAEVIAPAVVQPGRLLRRGQAVIAIPAPAAAGSGADATENAALGDAAQQDRAACEGSPPGDAP
jgi:hypothetical protein